MTHINRCACKEQKEGNFSSVPTLYSVDYSKLNQDEFSLENFFEKSLFKFKFGATKCKCIISKLSNSTII